MSVPIKLFLSHDWAFQGQNHAKVSIIQRKLASKVQVAWFDDQQITPGENLYQKISNGILDCDVVLVFVTENYQNKFNAGVSSDYCYFELKTALLENKYIIPIYLEHCEQYPPFKTFIAPLLGVDMKDPFVLTDEIKLDELCDRIVLSAMHLKNPGSSSSPSTFVYFDHLLGLLKIRLEDPVDNGWKLQKEREKYLEGTREWLLKEVFEWIPTGHSKVCWIRGEAGTGKTVISAKLASLLGRQLTGIFFFMFNDARCSDPCEMIRSIIYQIAKENRALRDIIFTKISAVSRISSLSPKELMGILIEILTIFQEQQSTQGHYVIILDALDELGTADNKRQRFLLFLSQQLIDKLPDSFRIIVTGRPEEDVQDALRAWDPFIIDETDIKHQEDMMLYIRCHLREYTENAEELTSLTTLLMEKSEGKFVYLHAMADRLSNLRGSTVEIRSQTINEFPQGLNEYYFKYFCQLRERLDEDKMKKLMKMISIIIAAKEPVSLDDLEWLLEDEILTNCVSEMKSLFPLDEESRLFKVYHKSIVDYLLDKKNSGEFYISVPEAHQFLSLKLLEFYEMEVKPEGPHFHVMTVQYMYRYLLDHLDEGPSSGQQKTFKKLVSLSWLQEAVREKGIAAVIQDCYKRISNPSWLTRFLKYREEIREIYWFLKLIVHTDLPHGSDLWASMLCTQITGRLEDKKEYRYSKEMKDLIRDAKEWLGKGQGYAFLQPSPLKTSKTSRDLLRLASRDFHCTPYLLTDNKILALSGEGDIYLRCFNVRTNVEEWNIFIGHYPVSSSSFGIAVLSSRKVIVIDREVITLWDIVSQRKVSEINPTKPSIDFNIHCLCAIPNEEKVIIWTSFTSTILLWDGEELDDISLPEYPDHLECCSMNDSTMIVFISVSSGLFFWNVQTKEVQHLLLLEHINPLNISFCYVELVIFPESKVVVTFSNGNNEIPLLMIQLRTKVTRHLSIDGFRVSSACERSSNLALFSGESIADGYCIKTIDINTLECLQTFPTATELRLIRCIDSIVLVDQGGDLRWTVFELPSCWDNVPQSTNKQDHQVLRATVNPRQSSRLLGFFRVTADNHLLSLEESRDKHAVTVKLVSYEIDRVNLTYSRKELKDIISFQGLDFGMYDFRYQIDLEWHKLLVFHQFQEEVFLIGLGDNSCYQPRTAGRKYFSGIPFPNNRIILEGTMGYKVFESLQLEYSIDIPGELVGIAQISEQEVLFVMDQDLFVWHLELRQMKCFHYPCDAHVRYHYKGMIRDDSFRSSTIDCHVIIDRIDWEKDLVYYHSIPHRHDLLSYAQDHHLPLHLSDIAGTSLSAIWVDSPSCSRCFVHEDLLVLYPFDGYSWHFLLGTERGTHPAEGKSTSGEWESLSLRPLIPSDATLFTDGSGRGCPVYNFHPSIILKSQD